MNNARALALQPEPVVWRVNEELVSEMRRSSDEIRREVLHERSHRAPQVDVDVVVPWGHRDRAEPVPAEERSAERVVLPDLEAQLRPALNSGELEIRVDRVAPDAHARRVVRAICLRLAAIQAVNKLPLLARVDPPAAEGALLEAGRAENPADEVRVRCL